jgi:hypothetical protein
LTSSSEITIKGKIEGISVSEHILSPRRICSAAISESQKSITSRKKHRTDIAVPVLDFLSADIM